MFTSSIGMAPIPQSVKQYHVFLASPSDVNEERQVVRRFFERYNRHTAQLWGARFEVVDWENYATVGVGRPQELITKQTLERFKGSLALVIGIMAQRFGSPTGTADSGTEEEFFWALNSNLKTGFPEIKWFFKRVDQFVAPPDPEAVTEALDQWKKVRAFRQKMKDRNIFFAEYLEASALREIFDNDLNLWFNDHARPWVETTATPKRWRHSVERKQIPSDQIEELKASFPAVLSVEERGFIYFLIPNLSLPSGTSPPAVDVLLRPTADEDGYPSRLFFAEKVESQQPLNWNTNGVRILERNWYAYSWIIDQQGLRLIQLLALHLRALK